MEKVLSINYYKNISKDFYMRYGFSNSSKHFANIINDIAGTDYKAVAFKEWKAPLKKYLGRKKELIWNENFIYL